MKFEKLQVGEPKHEFVHGTLSRSPVPGGWLVCVFWNASHVGGQSITFYPDPDHQWDGSSLHLENEGDADIRTVA
jgi:hypothetical protein